MRNEVRSALIKLDNFTIPEVQMQTGYDYGSIKKCVDELVANRVYARGEGLNYFRLRETSGAKRKSREDNFRSLFEDEDEETEEPYPYADMPAPVFKAKVRQKLVPADISNGDAFKITFGDVLPEGKKLIITLEEIDGKFVFSDGGAAFAAATTSGRTLSFRFFINKICERGCGEFGRVRVLPDKQITVPVMNLDYSALYLSQLVSAIRSFFGDKP